MKKLPPPVGRQAEVVYLPSSGHTIVLGTAGSGKTTMAMLRAMYLQERCADPGEKTLLVTFNRMLISYIKSFGASIPPGLDIQNYHAVARGYLNKHNKMGWNAILDANLAKQLIAKSHQDIKAQSSAPILKRSSPVFYEEIHWIERFGIRSLEQYLKAKRISQRYAGG